MAKVRSLDAKLSRLRQLQNATPSPEVREELRCALADRSNFVVAEAAETTGKLGLADLAPELVAAFNRLLVNPVKNDKMCRGKIAIAQALEKIEYLRPEVFLTSIRHVQPEPVWGGQQDTAVPLRAASAFALVRIGHAGVQPLLVDLLADPERGARAAAAQALAYSGTTAARLLLRFKARIGDEDPDVTAECFSGLLRLESEEALPFVAEFLRAHDLGVQEAAVMALGGSRRPEAVDLLEAFWRTQTDSTLRETALVALALLRQPAANAFLLALVASGSSADADAALAALAVHHYDVRIREQAGAAVAQSGNKDLQALFEKRFQAEE